MTGISSKQQYFQYSVNSTVIVVNLLVCWFYLMYIHASRKVSGILLLLSASSCHPFVLINHWSESSQKC